MSKDTCIKANTYCPVHKGIVGADCWHDSKDFSVPRTDWKQVDEITTLREQVKKLTKERDDLRSRRCEVCGYLEHEREHTGCLREQLASSESSPITEEVEDILRSEITKRDARIKDLEQAIDNEMVVSHLGVFNPGDDPKVALNKLQCYAEDLGSLFAQDQLNLQAAEIAQLKDALLRITQVKADTVTTAYDMRRIAIAAIKECENATN